MKNAKELAKDSVISTMKNAKEQAKEMIEMMVAQSGDIQQAKQCAAISCKYIINSNPHSQTIVPYCTKHYWQEVLNQIIVIV